mmetsp:Transcript_62308/g.146400  ORF Transcript_62308/g.146400 Transcript_62308/m.146400 type:complete len:122 (-) Transcript_62308:23-388(-)
MPPPKKPPRPCAVPALSSVFCQLPSGCFSSAHVPGHCRKKRSSVLHDRVPSWFRWQLDSDTLVYRQPSSPVCAEEEDEDSLEKEKVFIMLQTDDYTLRNRVQAVARLRSGSNAGQVNNAIW